MFTQIKHNYKVEGHELDSCKNTDWLLSTIYLEVRVDVSQSCNRQPPQPSPRRNWSSHRTVWLDDGTNFKRGREPTRPVEAAALWSPASSRLEFEGGLGSEAAVAEAAAAPDAAAQRDGDGMGLRATSSSASRAASCCASAPASSGWRCSSLLRNARTRLKMLSRSPCTACSVATCV